MPRKPRIELGGALYHIISRGNNRRKIFRSGADYLRFTEILEQQKSKLPFYLYAYCLMPNHFHLLIEMQHDSTARIMQRAMTSYSQFHNRKYKKIGHLFAVCWKAALRGGPAQDADLSIVESHQRRLRHEGPAELAG